MLFTAGNNPPVNKSIPLGAFFVAARLEFSDGLDGFGTGFGNQHDRAAFITEGGADGISEVFLVLRGEKFVSIDE